MPKPYRNGETYFDGVAFAAFCDRHTIISWAKYERTSSYGDSGRAIFLNGVQLRKGRDMNLISKLRAGRTKTISLPRAEELLVRHDLLLIDFEAWYEEQGS